MENRRELHLELQDTQWPFTYTDHVRQIVRAIVFDAEGYLYFVRVHRNDMFGPATLIETSGGGVEPGEDDETAIQRELREELGAKVDVLGRIGVVDDYYNLLHRRNINRYYLCRVRSFGETHMTRDEIEDFRLSTLKLRFDAAVREYERCADSKIGKLLKSRELPVLKTAGRMISRLPDGARPAQTVELEEIPADRLDDFWKLHIRYLTEDGIVTDPEDIAYFSGEEYRGVLKAHMLRASDRQHMAYFVRDGERIGAASYCTYQSEDGKCFLLDFWVFPEYRGCGTGRSCFEALKAHAKADGAAYFELNATKEDSIRFWKSLGFSESGADEYGMPLFVLR